MRHDPSEVADLGLLARFAGFIFRHHRLVGLVWLVVLIGAGYLATTNHDATSNNFSIPGTDSQAAYDLLQERFASQNSLTSTIVLEAAEGAKLTASAPEISNLVTELGKIPGVTSVSDPLSTDVSEQLEQVAATLPPQEAELARQLAAGLPPSTSPDGRVGAITVAYKAGLADLLSEYPPSSDEPATAYDNPYSQLQQVLDRATPAGIDSYIGGAIADVWNQPVSFWSSHADEVGLAIGGVLLLLAFGSLFGMLIPLVTALFGAVTASGFVYLLATQTTVSSAAPAVTLMISIGVGLDYSLLIVTRYREELGDGLSPHRAVSVAVATSGRSALFAGVTVVLALLGLLIIPIPLVRTLGLAAAIGVMVMMIAATTLLVALIGFAGNKIDRISIRRKRTEHVELTESFWGRFASRTGRHPWPALIGGTLILLVLAIPFTRIEFGMPGDNSLPTGLSQRNAFELLDSGFGAGSNGPLVVAIGLPNSVPYAQALGELSQVNTALGALKPPGTVSGIDYAVGPIPNDPASTSAVVYQIIPSTGPNDPSTSELVDTLRSNLATATAGTPLVAHVGGATATLIDLTDLVTQYLPFVIGAVVLGAFILLVLVFRSILVPLTAAVMNLISIAAAYGVVVAVFQWGWGKELVGISESIPIVSFVPLVMFVILFGLSMDYEVFLMSRIKEEWDATQDPKLSVVRGVAGTAKVITTAALIMMAVFLSFVANANPTVKLIGFGMAVAVLLDSTIVRMVLVPAIMEIFGRRAWWFPSWLQWLPRLDVEGRGVVERAVETPSGDS